jgi:hypothetical protein
MKNLAIALFYAQWAALCTGLLAAFSFIPSSPFVGLFLYLIFKEGSELAMSIALANGELDGTDSH